MDAYFDAQPQSPISGRAPELYRQHVLRDSTRVFKNNEGSVELFSWLNTAKGTLRNFLSIYPMGSDCEQTSIYVRLLIAQHPSFPAFKYRRSHPWSMREVNAKSQALQTSERNFL